MKLRNPFTENTQILFIDNYSCFKCGRSDRGLELNHTTGRDSDSPYNASPLCTECHPHIGHNEYEERELFTLTVKYLKMKGYKETQEDGDFVRKNKRLIINNNELKGWLDVNVKV